MSLYRAWCAVRTLVLMAVVACSIGIAGKAPANVQVFSQDPSPAGGAHKSSWYSPDGLDGDEYAYDSFIIPSGAAISEVRWRGTYANYPSGTGYGLVTGFTISIYRSIAGDSQPDMGTGGRLARYTVNGLAGETAAGTFGGRAMFDYSYTLTTPFQAVAGVKYWIQIEAKQGLSSWGWPPDWSLGEGLGGNGAYFRFITGGTYQMPPGDLAFSLWATSGATVTISASANPAGAGTITGTGNYPVGSTASLTATANAGYGFSNWTEGAAVVSTNPHYTFTANTNRTLVANFAGSYTITTIPSPTGWGTTSGDGQFIAGTSITVQATPERGYIFAGWTDGSTILSTAPAYTFTVTGDLTLLALFEQDPNLVVFDFNNAPQYTSLPVTISSGGIGLTASATQYGFSIQSAGAMGFTPAGFSGLCIYPNSVFAADLIFDFTTPLTYFSILYAPQELGCDTSATMRVTVSMNGSNTNTATAIAPVPGTWPTGTLSIATTLPFNHAVVHYDARPATCQDWGPIFLADNLIVTPAFICAADFNGDGVVDFFDYLDFVDAFVTGLPQADFNGDSVIDFFDYLDFVNAFVTGC